jgi:hypothetical protein
MTLPERRQRPAGALERTLHFGCGALVLGLPLAWLLGRGSWIAAALVLGACGTLGALRGDALYDWLSTSRLGAALRGLFGLRSR